VATHVEPGEMRLFVEFPASREMPALVVTAMQSDPTTLQLVCVDLVNKAAHSVSVSFSTNIEAFTEVCRAVRHCLHQIGLATNEAR
jgi:hypothetical protein